jgi:hypothetical protein
LRDILTRRLVLGEVPPAAPVDRTPLLAGNDGSSILRASAVPMLNRLQWRRKCGGFWNLPVESYLILILANGGRMNLGSIVGGRAKNPCQAGELIYCRFFFYLACFRVLLSCS